MTNLTACGTYSPAEKRAITRALNILREKQPNFYSRKQLNDSGAAMDYCALQLVGRERERFLCIFLDTQHGVLGSEILFEGTINSSAVYPREIIRKVFEYNAAAVILAHNHLSGEPTPSQADIAITREIREALTVINVALLDHVVVGNGQGCPCVSMAQRGLL